MFGQETMSLFFGAILQEAQTPKPDLPGSDSSTQDTTALPSILTTLLGKPAAQQCPLLQGTNKQSSSEQLRQAYASFVPLLLGTVPIGLMMTSSDILR